MERILVVDDDKDLLKTAETYLCEIYNVFSARYGEKGIEIFKKERPRVVITDIKMPGMDGIDVLREIKTIDKDAEVILITGHGDMDDVIKALRLGASDFIIKPMDVGLLELAIDKAIIKQKARSEIRNLLGEIKSSLINLEAKLYIASLCQCINENVEIDPEIVKFELEKINRECEKWEGFLQSV